MVGVTPHQRKISDLVTELLEWYSKNARDLPWRQTKDPYGVHVSEVMLQQTQVHTVIPYWKRWMEALPDIRSLARAKPEKLHKLWEGLGYYSRVRNLQKAALVIVERHGGRFPTRFEDVLELPGVGRYTAGAVCSIAFNQAKPILDGNVMRVLCRLFGVEGDPRAPKTNESLWRLAEQLVEQADLKGNRNGGGTDHPVSELNQSLMELGALICTARQPRCGECPVSGICVARKENRVGELPRRIPRPPAVARRFMAFVVEQTGRFLVRQRPAEVVNAHFWEFPNLEILGGKTNPKDVSRKVLGGTMESVKPLCAIKHTITRYRITLEVFEAVAKRHGKPRVSGGQWVSVAELHRLPLTSAHKKILQLMDLRMGEDRRGRSFTLRSPRSRGGSFGL